MEKYKVSKFICRVCKKREGKIVIDLGNQPLANAIINRKKKEKEYPLKVFICSSCKTLQLTKIVNPKILFDKYVWVTGTSNTTKRYLLNLSNYISNKFNKDKNLRVLEVASNDGSFLKILKKKFNNVYGVEPAKNIAKLANKNKLLTYNYYFNFKNSKKIKKKINSKLDLIICRNVIPHISNLNTVFKAVNYLLKKDGKLIVEFHYAKNILSRMQFDYIYHEHTYYFTIKTLSEYLKKYNLFANDVVESKISGGSLVLTFSYKNNQSKKLKKMINVENKHRINSYNKIKTVNQKLVKYKRDFKKLLYRNKNYKIAGYGSSARSNTLINFLEFSEDNLDCIFDKNTLKHNKFTPGKNLKILKPIKKEIIKFDIIIIFAWNFYEEIKNYLKNIGFKGRIVKTLPKLKIEKI